MPTPNELGPVAWHISTRSSSGGGSCVEAGPILDSTARIALRHSHHPTGPIQVYPSPAWTTFLTAIKAGHFDLNSR